LQKNHDTTAAADCQTSKNIDHRRKRINRIKTVIVIIVILLLIMPTIICIFLGIEVNRLQKQMKELVDLHSQNGITYEDSGSIDYAYAAEKAKNGTNEARNLQQDQASSITIAPTIPPTIPTTIPSTIPSTIQPPIPPTTLQTTLPTVTPTPVPALLPTINPAYKSDVMAFNQDCILEDGDQTDTDSNDNNLDPDKINNIPDPTEPAAQKQDTAVGNQAASQTEDSENTDGIYAGKKVYLTFDDGPSIYTGKILDILADYHVKATFFVIGKTDSKSKELYKRIVEEGHTLGMHSYSHKYSKIYNSVEDFDKDFTKLWKLLYDTTGYKPSIYRFPGGSDNLVNKNGMNDFIRYLNDSSIVYFDWNVVNGDATGIKYTKNQLTKNILNGVAVKKRSIVLMHDSQSKQTTVDSLPGLLEKLIEGGAQVLPLDKDVRPMQMIKADSVK